MPARRGEGSVALTQLLPRVLPPQLNDSCPVRSAPSKHWGARGTIVERQSKAGSRRGTQSPLAVTRPVPDLCGAERLDPCV
eukprot:2063089-Prymnesium_polylepis.2